MASVIAAALTIALQTAATSEPTWAPLVRSLPCAQAVESRLRAWHASDSVFRAAPGLDGGERFRIPTSELGVWITLEFRPGAEGRRVRIIRSSAASGLGWELDASCNASQWVLPGLSVGIGPVFTDEDLKRELEAHPRLLVYLWTPHLPLSVEGYHEAVRAASSSSVSLVAVVDPAAEPDYVREVANAENIPESARRRVASVELLFRNLAVHAPSVLLFERGRVSPVLPGYRNARAYRDYLGPSR